MARRIASDFSRERFAESDLVIGVGAGLGHYTTEGGYLYPGAQVVQIDNCIDAVLLVLHDLW